MRSPRARPSLPRVAELSDIHAGPLLTEVSNAIVRLHREHFGRGPESAKTFAFDGMLMCVMRGVFTTVEKTLIEAGAIDHVRQTRMLHQEAAAGQYRAAVERVLGREVIAFSSTVHFDPDLAMEIFVLGELPAELAGGAESG